MTHRMLLVAMPLAVFTLAVPAAGQNLISNGDFDHDLAGWELAFGADGSTKSWSPLDAHGSAASGSALLTHAGPGEGSFASVLQCVAVEGERTYQLSGELLIPSTQSRTGSASIGTTWWKLPGCEGVAIDAPSHFLPTTAVGGWQIVSGTRTAPADAVSALVRLVTFKSEAGGSFRAHFDNVELVEGAPEPPPGPWLTTLDQPDFRFKVRITAGDTQFPGTQVDQCIVETLCAAGALVGRPEVFVKIIGPRPNGFLWVQISRFTPSRLEVWVEQLSSNQVNYYTLARLAPAETDVSGLQDREAFLP